MVIKEKNALGCGQDLRHMPNSKHSNSCARWYVIRTVPRGEFLAENELRRDGFDVVIPLLKVSDTGKGIGYVPIFPGYLFLSCDEAVDGLPSLKDSSHVLGWLNFGGEITPLPAGLLEDLLSELESNNTEDAILREFRSGENVLVVGCSVNGAAVVVENRKSACSRIRVLMEFMGGVVSAQVPVENVESIGPSIGLNGVRGTRGRGRRVNRLALKK